MATFVDDRGDYNRPSIGALILSTIQKFNSHKTFVEIMAFFRSAYTW